MWYCANTSSLFFPWDLDREKVPYPSTGQREWCGHLNVDFSFRFHYGWVFPSPKKERKNQERLVPQIQSRLLFCQNKEWLSRGDYCKDENCVGKESEKRFAKPPRSSTLGKSRNLPLSSQIMIFRPQCLLIGLPISGCYLEIPSNYK